MRRRLLAICLILAVAVGWLAIRHSNPSGSRAADSRPVAPPAATGPRAGKAATPADIPMDLATWESRIASADDLSRLMTAAMKIGDAELQRAVVALIIDRWLVVDADGFIKHLNALEVAADRGSLAVVMLALQDSLTRLSPGSAGSDEVLVVVQRLISHLASTDPAKALEWATRFLLEDTLDSALVSIARGMTRTDVQAGLKIAEGIRSPLRRSQAFAAVGTVWAGQDPAAALGWAVSLKNHAERALATNSVLLVTAGKNLAAAASSLSEQARAINDEYLKERAADLAARGLTAADQANDSETYLELLESGDISAPSSPDIELLAGAGKRIASQLAKSDADGAVVWAESLDGDFLKLTSLSGALDGWARNDPAAALSFVDGNYPENLDLYQSVYRAWAATDPGAAARSAGEIAEPGRRSTVLESVMKAWAADGDANEAAAFLAQLPASESTDAASHAVAMAMSYHQPERAWEVARTITNEASQYRALKSAFSVMVTRDPEAAGRLLDASELPPRTTELLSGILSAVTSG